MTKTIMNRETEIPRHRVFSSGKQALEKNQMNPIIKKKKNTKKVPTPIPNISDPGLSISKLVWSSETASAMMLRELFYFDRSNQLSVIEEGVIEPLRFNARIMIKK